MPVCSGGAIESIEGVGGGEEGEREVYGGRVDWVVILQKDSQQEL